MFFYKQPSCGWTLSEKFYFFNFKFTKKKQSQIKSDNPRKVFTLSKTVSLQKYQTTT